MEMCVNDGLTEMIFKRVIGSNLNVSGKVLFDIEAYRLVRVCVCE